MIVNNFIKGKGRILKLKLFLIVVRWHTFRDGLKRKECHIKIKIDEWREYLKVDRTVFDNELSLVCERWTFLRENWHFTSNTTQVVILTLNSLFQPKETHRIQRK